jgi:hypothetical protein
MRPDPFEKEPRWHLVAALALAWGAIGGMVTFAFAVGWL